MNEPPRDEIEWTTVNDLRVNLEHVIFPLGRSVVLDAKEFTRGWNQFQRRCAVAKSIGISAEDHVQGTPVPNGWELDIETCYWLPPNVVLF